MVPGLNYFQRAHPTLSADPLRDAVRNSITLMEFSGLHPRTSGGILPGFFMGFEIKIFGAPFKLIAFLTFLDKFFGAKINHKQIPTFL